jgi:hypothetical protein
MTENHKKITGIEIPNNRTQAERRLIQENFFPVKDSANLQNGLRDVNSDAAAGVLSGNFEDKAFQDRKMNPGMRPKKEAASWNAAPYEYD